MINKLFQTAHSLIHRKQTNILSAASLIMATVLASRVLGLIRDRLLTSRFVTTELGVYWASFRLPDLIVELLVIGTVSTAFIPVLSDYLAKNKEREAFAFASSVINLATILFIILLIPLFIFTPYWGKILVPGFTDQELQQWVFFTRLILSAQVLPLLIGNFLTGILQSYKHFLLPALAPVIYNLGIIAGVIFLEPFFGLTGVVIGVFIGALFFLIIQIPQARSLGYHHFWSLNLKDSGTRKVFKLALPRTISLGFSQIDSTIDLILASLLGSSSVTIFTLAQHLQRVPIGLFGLTIAQATLPTLSQKSSLQNMKEFKETFLASWHQILFLILPASAILVTLRIPAVRLVFGAEKFDWQATYSTSKTLSFFAVALFAQASIQLFTRAFFALQDSKTPVITSALGIIINSLLSIYFIKIMGLPVWFLGLSASIGAFVNSSLMLYLLDQKIGKFDRYQIIIPPLKMAVATVLMIIFLQIPKTLLESPFVFDTTRTSQLILFTLTVSFIGLFVYAFMAWFLNIKEVLTFYNLLKKVIKVKDVVIDPGREIVSIE